MCGVYRERVYWQRQNTTLAVVLVLTVAVHVLSVYCIIWLLRSVGSGVVAPVWWHSVLSPPPCVQVSWCCSV